MVKFPNELKFLEWDENPQTNKQTNKDRIIAKNKHNKNQCIINRVQILWNWFENSIKKHHWNTVIEHNTVTSWRQHGSYLNKNANINLYFNFWRNKWNRQNWYNKEQKTRNKDEEIFNKNSRKAISLIQWQYFYCILWMLIYILLPDSSMIFE